MTVYIELTTDAFEEVFQEQSGRAATTSGGVSVLNRAGRSVVRRPLRGIEIHDDTYASLRVVQANGQPIAVLDSGAPYGANTTGYANFLLTSVQESRAEKMQIVETFGDDYIYLFGEKPRMLMCAAVLLNTRDFNWRDEWWYNYENYFRGTKLAELAARCYLSFENLVIEGLMVNCTAAQSANTPYQVDIQFQYYVSRYHATSIANSKTGQYPISPSVRVPPFINLTKPDAFTSLAALYKGAAYRNNKNSYSLQGGKLLQGLESAQSFPNGRMLKDIMRVAAPSTVMDPALWPKLVSKRGIVDLNADSPADQFSTLSNSGSIRGEIRENVDEYIGGVPIVPNMQAAIGDPYAPPSQQLSAVRSIQDSLSILTAFDEVMRQYGIAGNTLPIMNRAGLNPLFNVNASASVSAFAGVGGNAGFSASASASASASLFGGVKATASFGGFASAQAYGYYGGAGGLGSKASSFGAQQRGSTSYKTRLDPLSAVYGSTGGAVLNASYSASLNASAGFQADARVTAGGASVVAQASAGKANFGVDPKKRNYTTPGAPDTRTAFERFLVPKFENTGGASHSTSGKPAPFALFVADGNFATGTGQRSFSYSAGASLGLNGVKTYEKFSSTTSRAAPAAAVAGATAAARVSAVFGATASASGSLGV